MLPLLELLEAVRRGEHDVVAAHAEHERAWDLEAKARMAKDAAWARLRSARDALATELRSTPNPIDFVKEDPAPHAGS